MRFAFLLIAAMGHKNSKPAKNQDIQKATAEDIPPRTCPAIKKEPPDIIRPQQDEKIPKSESTEKETVEMPDHGKLGTFSSINMLSKFCNINTSIFTTDQSKKGRK